jgi:hypothetical protein
MELGFGCSNADFAGFPAFRAIVFAVHAKANAFEALAIAAIPVAIARILGPVALRTQYCCLHFIPLQKKQARQKLLRNQSLL